MEHKEINNQDLNIDEIIEDDETATSDSADSKESELQESSEENAKVKFKDKIKNLLVKIKNNVLTLYLSFFEVAWYKKIFIFFILAYALSPIDLIPDFIPIIGLLDDLLIIPLGIFLARLMIPKDVWQKCKADVENGVKIKKSFKIIGCILILLIWAIIITAIVLHFVK